MPWVVTRRGQTVELSVLQDGKEPKPLERATDRLRTAGFSPIEHLLASAGPDGLARLWSTDTGKELMILQEDKEPKPIQTIAFSGDGTILATLSDDGTLRFYNAPGPRP